MENQIVDSDPEPEPNLRTQPSTSVLRIRKHAANMSDYRTQAHRLRNEAVTHAFEVAGAAIRRLIEETGRRLQAYWVRRSLRRELAQLEEWQLKDIGMSRNDFEAIADGTYFSDPTRRQRYRRIIDSNAGKPQAARSGQIVTETTSA